MTKYILNSGGVKKFPQKEIDFAKEMLVDFKVDDEVKILYCFFAQPREVWEVKYEKYKERYIQLIDSSFKINFELAYPEKFEEQIRLSNIIFILGGDDHLLKFWLRQFNLPKIWDGKIVATTSAGSGALVNSFWTCDWRKSLDGLNILPIKFIPHYKSETYGLDDPRGPIDWEKAYQEISEFGDKNLPIYALGEGDFIVFNQ
ncbi:MAG: hypothetical protein UR66_C0009G0070 [Candidatus Moranbacteria bacterium GW2011_GWE1_35_17]|nr:MAG: hypothetical protein UR65_C0074G0006 [Candidatus Moranbacteria bacterium GW2011_GWE2_35_164]KKP67980.1 MAG: hypothetical protein UR66_C0009G0070 [Candidatus Moranbacteria bacterium GW2011_GWE1_35_17]KKP83988.1 MAG: hypothetical protein UR83_C0029G0021 [Candidatus Moranbacteria bacterium GW2011_GWF2_35_54]